MNNNILAVYTPRNECHSGYNINYTFEDHKDGERYCYELLDPKGEWLAGGWSPSPSDVEKWAHRALEKVGVGA